MFNKNKTIDIQKEYTKKLKGHNLIACLEGTTQGELLQSIFASPKDIHAISSHIINTFHGIVRAGPIIYIDNHLNLEEVEDHEDDTLITSLPVRLGLQGRLLSDYRPSPSSLTFYEEENKYPVILRKNIEEVLRYYE